MVLHIISWLATILSFAGNYYLNRKNWKGYVLFGAANVFSIAFAISIQNYAQILMYAVFMYFNVDGIKRWRKQVA